MPLNRIPLQLVYEDRALPVAWLEDADGLVEPFRYGSPVAGVQMRAGRGDAAMNTAVYAERQFEFLIWRDTDILKDTRTVWHLRTGARNVPQKKVSARA